MACPKGLTLGKIAKEASLPQFVPDSQKNLSLISFLFCGFHPSSLRQIGR